MAITYEKAYSLTRNSQMALYIMGANSIGAKYKVVIPALFTDFEKDGKHWRIHKALTPINDSVAMSLATYKNTCNRFLASRDLPVPNQAPVESVEDIEKYINKTGIKDIVIKPTRGFGGSGVNILPDTPEIIAKAYETAHRKSLSKYEPKVLVEEFIHGENYRILVLGDKVIAAAHRVAAFVVGDGNATIQMLIDTKNPVLKNQGRSTITVDNEVTKCLATCGMTLEAVPGKDQKVTLRFNTNMSTGGSTRECLAEVHDLYKEISIKATQEIGLKLSGIDIITPDISNPDTKFGINEVNHDPGLRIHYMPDEGEPATVASKIQKYIFENL